MSPDPAKPGSSFKAERVAGNKDYNKKERVDVAGKKDGFAPDRCVSLRPLTNKPMLHIIWSIIVGFIVGLCARALMPGMQHLGFVMTTLLGVGGSIVGGLVGRLFSKPEPGSSFHAAGFIMSVIFAILLLFIWGRLHP